MRAASGCRGRSGARRCASVRPETVRLPPGRRGRRQPWLLNNCGINRRRGRGGPGARGRASAKTWLGHPGAGRGAQAATLLAPGRAVLTLWRFPRLRRPSAAGAGVGPRGQTLGVFLASSAPSHAFRGRRSRLSRSLLSGSPLPSLGLPRSGSLSLQPLPLPPPSRCQTRARPCVPARGGAGGPWVAH